MEDRDQCKNAIRSLNPGESWKSCENRPSRSENSGMFLEVKTMPPERSTVSALPAAVL